MNHPMFSSKRAGKKAGYTLLEMLVSLIVVSVGLLGVATLQTRGQQFNYFSYVRTQATYLVYDLMERMRTNSKEAATGAYEFDSSSETPSEASKCDGTSDSDAAKCTFSELVADDKATWVYLLQDTLPEGHTEVKWDSSAREYTITLTWSKGEEKTEPQEWRIKL